MFKTKDINILFSSLADLSLEDRITVYEMVDKETNEELLSQNVRSFVDDLGIDDYYMYPSNSNISFKYSAKEVAEMSDNINGPSEEDLDSVASMRSAGIQRALQKMNRTLDISVDPRYELIEDILSISGLSEDEQELIKTDPIHFDRYCSILHNYAKSTVLGQGVKGFSFKYLAANIDEFKKVLEAGRKRRS